MYIYVYISAYFDSIYIHEPTLNNENVLKTNWIWIEFNFVAVNYLTNHYSPRYDQ